MPYTDHSVDLNTTFQQLDAALTDHQNLWGPQPFTSDDLPWFHTHPHLKDALLSLTTDKALELHDNQQHRINWFRELEPELCAQLFAYQPSPIKTLTKITTSRFDSIGISSRKWQQITAFAGALPSINVPVVDWCAGKGHLSRIVQRSQQQPVHCLEWDEALVYAGTALAKKQQQDIHYHHQDVMQALPAPCDNAAAMHIGLHACGELHLQLVRHVVNSRAKSMALSPCCYHKISDPMYQPLSKAAQGSRLKLNRQALHLAVQDPVTARHGERLLREQERLWRLGFDLLQRDLRGIDEYLNVPSSNSKLLRQDFTRFCHWAAAARNLTLPDNIDYGDYLQRGTEKHQRIIRLDLLRRLFNRPIEIWLVLDKALYLQQHGYEVSIYRFCESIVSPRNLLIQAQRV